jgi:DNA-binding transcriptional LysR family regulator
MERNLDDVLVFARVVEEGSFTGASKVLGFPKSTVSRRISRLEDRLGVRLLQRTTRKLSLTDAGRLYYDRCMRIVSELEDAERAVTEMQEVPRGRLRVTAPVEMGVAFWELLNTFLETYPEVQLDLDLTNRYVNIVEEGYDVAIRGGSLSDSSLIARKLDDSHSQLVASPSYVERRGAPTTPEELKDHDCILFTGRSTHTTWNLQGDNGVVHVRVKGRLAMNHLSIIRRAALAGFGIAHLPSFFIDEELTSGTLIEILPGSGMNTQGLYIVYPSTRHLAPKVRSFVDFMVKYYKEYRERLIDPSIASTDN